MDRYTILLATTSTLAATAFASACAGNGSPTNSGNTGSTSATTMGGAQANTSGGTGTAVTTVASTTSASGGSAPTNTGGSPSAGGAGTTPSPRAFLMGSTPFFTTPTAFPDWRFENMDDRDLLSLHVDEFWGVPWDQCGAAGCQNLPATWVAKWQDLADRARATHKPIYLAVSPLGDRKTLARRVLTDGSLQDHWVASTLTDSAGCYLFASDANAGTYKTAYVAFLKYLIELIKPTYVSPAIEMNLPFTSCTSQKSAWVSWYTDVHNALKAAYPSLILFPTFQLEHLYGISDSQSACADNVSTDQCFSQRLSEALTIPGDRIAFSTYPWSWRFSATASFKYPTDTYSRVSAATTRKIWVSETGWASVPIRASYAHGNTGSCGSYMIPATFEAPGLGTLGIANDSEHAAYLSWLLNEAQAHGFEAVVWWLNRDYLDGTAAAACPCTPSASDTCKLTDSFYASGAETGELTVRLFANMGLRNYDGTPRVGYSTWVAYLNRPLGN